MLLVKVYNPHNFLKKKDRSLIRQIANVIYVFENLQNTIYIDLTITDHNDIHKLNKQYRNKDYPTDVLSFPLWQEGEIKTKLLGEIYLNYQKVIEQANEYGHSFEREFGFLLSHGIYHLLGYDHIKKEEAKVMFDKQEKVLIELNLTRN